MEVYNNNASDANKERPYLLFCNGVQWVLYILNGDLLNSALLV